MVCVGVPGFLVAIKELKTQEASAQEELMREAAFMAQLNCDYIVKLHGVVTVFRLSCSFGLIAHTFVCLP